MCLLLLGRNLKKKIPSSKLGLEVNSTPHRCLVKVPMLLKKIGDIESLVVCKYLQFEVHLGQQMSFV